jgi:hypothetical protein
MVNFMPSRLYTWGKNPWYKLNVMLGGPQAGVDISEILAGIKPWIIQFVG